jgi:hypothetical protein
MVDALSRAHSLLDPAGVVIDVHPTPEPAHLAVVSGSEFLRIADRLDDGTAAGPRARHLAADRAVESAIGRGIFKRDRTTTFTFHTHADTVEELLEFLETKWKQLHFATADLEHARDVLSRGRAASVVVIERVTASRLAR